MTRYVGARACARVPEVGAIVAINHAAFRVLEVNPIPETEWTDDERRFVDLRRPELRDRFVPVYIVVRPAHITGDDPTLRQHDRHFRFQAVRMGGLHVYENEHYPVCATCGEPVPCRDQLQAEQARQAVERMSRYEDPGLCPHCQEGFGPRQQTRTFGTNIEIPGGPPVRFHMRRGCQHAAERYAKRCGEQSTQAALPFNGGDVDD